EQPARLGEVARVERVRDFARTSKQCPPRRRKVDEDRRRGGATSEQVGPCPLNAARCTASRSRDRNGCHDAVDPACRRISGSTVPHERSEPPERHDGVSGVRWVPGGGTKQGGKPECERTHM